LLRAAELDLKVIGKDIDDGRRHRLYAIHINNIRGDEHGTGI